MEIILPDTIHYASNFDISICRNELTLDYSD